MPDHTTDSATRIPEYEFHQKILLLVTGSIAAYKSVLLLRRLQEEGIDVQVAATRSALAFVGEATWEGLTGHKVHSDTLAPGGMMGHIDLPDQADLLIVCPATANTLAKLAGGQAGDLVSAMCLATTAPVLLAPAMNVNMWNHPATRRNLETLRQDGYKIIEPGSGHLACGWEGPGRLTEVDLIFEQIMGSLTPQDLTDKRLLITAGPSREYLDPVRFLSNPSSGKMGIALARMAARRGAIVDLLLGEGGVVPAALPASVNLIHYRSAADLLAAAQARFPTCDWLIAAAAVADYTTDTASDKQKKKDGDLSIELHRTTDVLATVSRDKKPSQKSIGFAAETHDLLTYGKQKLTAKNLDAIVCNKVGDPSSGFAANHNAGILLFADDARVELLHTSKEQMAAAIFDQLVQKWLP